jgi:putative ABC transport system substrate-binding protein
VREPDDFERAFSAMNRERPDAMIMVTDVLTNLNRKRVLDYAEAHRIPAMYEFASFVREDGLMSYGPSDDYLFGRAAVYVDKILKGAKPSELPAEEPTVYHLVVNPRTVKTLGLKIPQSLLLRAELVQ